MIAALQELVETSFPASSDGSLIRGLTEGIALADQLRNSDPILRTPIGKDMAGHLRRAGIIWRIQDLCLRGELPFKASIELMAIGSWHHLELRPNDAIVSHLCRSENSLAFPKDTPNRQDERLSNQPSLFDAKVISMAQAIEDVPEKCVWLTYGVMSDGVLTHAC